MTEGYRQIQHQEEEEEEVEEEEEEEEEERPLQFLGEIEVM